MAHILTIMSGGIAVIKAADLLRRLREQGHRVTPVMTRGAQNFVTPLAISALAGEKVRDDLWDVTEEAEMGHISLARAPDLIVIAPATANLLAKMAHGMADDLASTLLLATDRPILVAPAMNPVMWQAPATQANVQTLQQRGIAFIGPASGEMACGETGPGRLADIPDIVQEVQRLLTPPDMQVVR
ncbi:MAG: hypothetical protein Alpg2KO_07860 [Alphaproteobacteria bacterium]